jgi:ABC-type nitrate/sulfonate/bicarbonate transport system substrate-binding protein
LDSLLPTAIGIGTAIFAPELLPVVAGGVGLEEYARTGDIGKGFLAGLGTYGGGSLTSGFMSAGADALAPSVAQAGNTAVAGSSAGGIGINSLADAQSALQQGLISSSDYANIASTYGQGASAATPSALSQAGAGVKATFGRDLKGKRVPSGYHAQKAIHRSIEAHLANAGLTYDDVKQVPVPNAARGAEDFGNGKTDALFFALGSAAVMEVSTKVGGLRVLPIDDSPEAVARMQKISPPMYVSEVKPRSHHGRGYWPDQSSHSG